MGCPLFIELCAGTAALSLRYHAGRNARPPVSRMGAKTGYADVILRVLGLRPGQGHQGGTRYLWCEPDAGVRLLLHAYTDRELAQAAADIIRSWRDEDPRALWERLRAEGPATGPDGLTAREVARWLLGEAWTNSGRYMGPDRPSSCHPPGWVASITRRGLAGRANTLPTLPAAIHPDARAIDPREVARVAWFKVRTMPQAQARGARAGDFLPQVAPAGRRRYADEAPAQWFDVLPALPATIHPDARAIDPPTLPPGTVAYMDPPYLNTTGYAHDLGRDEVVRIARRWADAGALVCISEAEPIPELVADGWHQVEVTGERKGARRTFSKQQAEWLTMSRPPAWTPSIQAGLFQ